MPKLLKGIFKRGACYCTRLRSGGRDRWISLGSDYQDACDKLRVLRRNGGKPRSRLTVADCAAKWLLNSVPMGREPKGVALAAQRVRTYLNPFMGHLQVAQVVREDLRAYRRWLEQKSLALLSVRHILSDARCFFRWAEDAELIDRAPVPRRLLPRAQERPPDRLTDGELARVMAVPDPYGFICRFLVHTGLRWGEAVRAQIADIQDGRLVVHKTKSKKLRRVPLPSALREELRGRVGRIIGLTDSEGLAKIVRRESGVARFHAHQLRHTFACRWLEQGGSLAALQQILGHASIVTTQQYARISDDLVRREAERLDLASGQ